jgi:hypothetical protein
MVSQESIERFSARFIPLSRIAKQHCIAPQCSAHWARSTHLSLVSGPDVDGGRQYFVEAPPRMIASKEFRDGASIFDVEINGKREQR